MASVSPFVSIAVVSTVVATGNRTSHDETQPPAFGTAVHKGIAATGNTLGITDAKATVVEYADYQRPYCATYATPDEGNLIDDVVKWGKIAYTVGPMPIIRQLGLTDPDNESVLAAEASLCAGDQDQFRSRHHRLFSKWTGEVVGAFTTANLSAYASAGGPDVWAFSTGTSSGKLQGAAVDGQDKGISDGVRDTPACFINGVLVMLTPSGDDALKLQIQDAINGKPVDP